MLKNGILDFGKITKKMNVYVKQAKTNEASAIFYPSCASSFCNMRESKSFFVQQIIQLFLFAQKVAVFISFFFS